MNYYEFIMFDKNGCKWNFKDCDDNVVIKAHSEKEATYIFLSAVDSEYKKEAEKYYASKIDNMIVYAENHYYTIWEWNESGDVHSEIRLIDANALKEDLKSLECDTNNLKLKAIVEAVLYELIPQIIDNAPTYDIIEDGE